MPLDSVNSKNSIHYNGAVDSNKSPSSFLPRWQAELASAFSDPRQLLAFLNLEVSDPGGLLSACQGFPFRVTHAYAERMRKGDAQDPLLRQVLPLAEELEDHIGFGADPVGDLNVIATPGLLHKYQGRILMITTGACAIHCRYCFRREFPYGDNLLSKRREEDALDHIAKDDTLREVILSGGDPLVLTDSRLQSLIAGIEALPHISRLRIHSRLPIVLPTRITPELTRMLGESRLRTVVVIHANHPNELDDSVSTALQTLSRAGVSLLNQAVLLKGVNDQLDCLKQLSERLFTCGVLPYYLHVLDRAKGTAHFEVAHERALELHDALRQELPGYLVPRLVQEVAGEPYKTPLS